VRCRRTAFALLYFLLLTHFPRQSHPAVDAFHFSKNHTGKYCHKHCNPNKNDVLSALKQSGALNLSVCEQRFSKLSRYRFAFASMNMATFNFMAQLLVWLDHRSFD
jgi:hypothetical protein